uniref:Uncharacterized protein n=1 Tax=Panagrolaimus davidi TaxID=227884 RepID=A0A914PBL8_9BILA
MTDENVDTEKFKQCLPNSMRLSSLDIYETASHFYIIGTDSTKIKYHVLKLDRNADQTFLVGEPNHSYTRKDVDELLSTISSSSVVTSQKSRSSGNALLQTIKGAYGILGALLF